MLLSRNGRSDDQARTDNSDCHCIVDYNSKLDAYASIPDFDLDAINSNGYTNLHLDSYRNGHRNFYSDQFSYALSAADFYVYSNSNQHADAYRYSNSDLNANQNLNSFSNFHFNFHGDVYFHRNSDSDLNANLYTDLYTNFYTNPYTNHLSNGYCFSNEYCCGHSIMDIAKLNSMPLDRLKKVLQSLILING